MAFFPVSLDKNTFFRSFGSGMKSLSSNKSSNMDHHHLCGNDNGKKKPLTIFKREKMLWKLREEKKSLTYMVKEMHLL